MCKCVLYCCHRLTTQLQLTNISYHILSRNYFLKHVIEEKTEGIEVTGRRGIRKKQLPDDLKEMKASWKLKGEALDHTLWRTRYRRGYGHVVRLTTE